ncbi:MAG: putative heavy metal-binding protein [Agathobacter sp.]|nr:putative heavy metal-binding protein [Agathobacter sp.]
MLVTTTSMIEGMQIKEYKGLVFGEVISGVNLVKDFTAGLSNIFGGRSNTYEGELLNAREKALEEMQQRAEQMGANAIIGIDIDYEVLGADNGMLMVTASGTAVVVSKY